MAVSHSEHSTQGARSGMGYYIGLIMGQTMVSITNTTLPERQPRKSRQPKRSTPKTSDLGGMPPPPPPAQTHYPGSNLYAISPTAYRLAKQRHEKGWYKIFCSGS